MAESLAIVAERHQNDAMTRGSHVLIVVQNLPVPLDRRVWLECQALTARGYEVSVICPKGPGDPERQTIDGVRIFKYAPAPEAHGLVGYSYEFTYCWLRTAWLSMRVWRERRFDVIQACNPPDTYWLLARLWRSRGVKFVFDHHDLNPELFLSRFGKPTGMRKKLAFWGLRRLEEATFASADEVISTNESYRQVAIRRGGIAADRATVVRSGPDTSQMRPVVPRRKSPDEPSFTLAYLGIMGPQDGVDIILDVMHELVHNRGRKDVNAVLMGFGDCLEDLKHQTQEMKLADVVTFTGRADKPMIAEHLSAADVGLCPDLKSPLNDLSTMNKTMEYMSYGLPSVSFDLKETRVSGGDSVLYVESGDVGAFADAIEQLLNDPQLREDMGLRALNRVRGVLDWRPQAEAYVGVYDRLFGVDTAGVSSGSPPMSPPLGVASAQTYVDILDEEALRNLIRHRGRVSGLA